MSKFRNLFLAAALAAAVPALARAAFVAPPTRPATVADAALTRATYQAYNTFSDDDLAADGIQDNAPDVASVNDVGVAALATPLGSFITSGGNLYNPSAPTVGTVTLPGYADVTRFVVQFRTLGGELVRANPLAEPTAAYDFAGLALDGGRVDALPNFSYAELTRATIPGGFGGEAVEHSFAFDAPAGSATRALGFAAATASVSVDQLAIDTVALVPESATLAALAGVALVALRRRA